MYGVADSDSGTGGVGVYGRADGGSVSYGVVGHAYWEGVGVGAWSYSGDLIRAYHGDYPLTDYLRFYVTASGYVYADGGYYTYSPIPGEPAGQQRALSTIASPESWFEDFGSASLVNGHAAVQIDRLFSQTVNLQASYHVFLTPVCQEPVILFVTDKGAAIFEVKGVTPDGEPSKCAFDYRIVAKVRGREDERLEAVSIPASVGSDAKEQPRDEGE